MAYLHKVIDGQLVPVTLGYVHADRIDYGIPSAHGIVHEIAVVGREAPRWGRVHAVSMMAAASVEASAPSRWGLVHDLATYATATPPHGRVHEIAVQAIAEPPTEPQGRVHEAVVVGVAA